MCCCTSAVRRPTGQRRGGSGRRMTRSVGGLGGSGAGIPPVAQMASGGSGVVFFLDARRGAVGWERRVVMGTTAPLP
jgi:hypothetical protein